MLPLITYFLLNGFSELIDVKKMGRRSAMDRLSLIDMSSEDDSLLPVSCQDAGHFNSPQTLFPPSTSASCKNNRLMPTHLHKDSRNMQESKFLCSSIPEESQILEEQFEHCNLEQKPVPPVFRRSKTVGHTNLRKSLAWDKAFLTGEGVLDLDELPVPPQRTKRLPELPSLEPSGFDGNSLPNPFKLAYGSQGTLSVMDKFTPVALEDTALPGKGIDGFNTKGPDEVENAGARPVVANSSGQSSDPCVRHEEAAKGVLDPSVLSGSNIEQKKLSMETSVATFPRAMITKPIPIKTVIEAAVQKGTRLRLPSSFIRKSEEKNSNHSQKVRINEHEDACLRREASPSSTLTSKVSAVSKKVKESLVKVLPGTSKCTTHEMSRAPQECSSDVAERTVRVHHLHAESLSTMPSAAPLSTTQMPKREVAFTTRKHDSDAIKPKVMPPLEDIKHKKVSSSGFVSSSANAPSHPVSMKVALPSTAADTQSKKCTVSSSSKYGSNAGDQCTKNHKRANKNSEKLQSVAHSTGSNSAGNLPVSSWKSKPSGLRMPSPKLGFFDSARVLTGVQPLILSEKADSAGAERALELEKNGQSRPCADTASISNRGLKHSLNLKTHGLPILKPSQRFSQKRAADTQVRAGSSSIPSAPHLRFPESASFPTVTSSASAPTSPSGQHTPLSPFSTGKKAITTEMLGLDCSTCEVGKVFREQTTAENVHDLPAYQGEGLNLKEMTSLEEIQSSIEVIHTDEFPDRVVTNNEDQMQCFPLVLKSSSSHTNADCVAVEKSSVPILANYSFLHTNPDTLISPPVEAHSLDCDTNTSTVVDNLERLDPISEMPTACPLVSEQIPDNGIPTVECSNDGSNSLIFLDGMCTDLGEQDVILAQISQEQKEEKPLPAFNQGAVHCLDSQDESFKETDKSATFCSSTEPLYKNQEKEDTLDGSPSHWLDWPVLKASAQKQHMSSELVIPTIPSNLDVDNSRLASTDKACRYSQQCDQPRSRSPLSTNVQLLIVDSPQNKNLHQTGVKKPVGKFTSLDSSKATLLSEKNDLLEDFIIDDGADKGNTMSDRGPIEHVNFEILSRECAFKENVFAPETIDLEDLAKSRGPVLHSPPNKTSPRPGSWSPVRRNMQQLGPFDCTKYLNSVVQRSEQ